MVMSEEMHAVGALLGDAVGEGVGLMREVHHAIAGRVFGALRHQATPVRLVHDAVTAATYATVRVGHRALPRVALSAAAPLAADGRSITSAPAGRLALGALNGLYGDHVERRYPALALPLALRAEGSDVALSPEGIAASYADPSSSLVIFVHGLCESEESWSLAAERHHGDRRVTYGSLLRDDLGFTPLYLRYNTGRHVSENARDLAELLEQLVESWPVPVDEIALVGHSMGGLVIRSACHQGAESGYSWVEHVRHVLCLGSPHLGAPLERGINVLSSVLNRVPETRPVARVLNARSAGVKDMRFGACVEADWHGHDPDEFLTDRCTEVPFLPHAAYYFVAATLVRDPAHPAAAWIGDLFVQLPSASGNGVRRRIPFEPENGAHFGRIHHFDLLNHPEVYDLLKRWVSRTRPSSLQQRAG